MRRNRWAALALACLLPLVAQAQKSAADGIAEYRKMLEDGNPAELFEMKGEELWKQARGPKKATLERCDLGLGPGVVKGAWVQLPRYFADTGRVQDVESRLVSCMATLQGFNEAELGKTPFGAAGCGAHRRDAGGGPPRRPRRPPGQATSPPG